MNIKLKKSGNYLPSLNSKTIKTDQHTRLSSMSYQEKEMKDNGPSSWNKRQYDTNLDIKTTLKKDEPLASNRSKSTKNSILSKNRTVINRFKMQQNPL